MSDRYVSQIDKFVGVDEPATLAISAFNAAEFALSRGLDDLTDSGELGMIHVAHGLIS